MCTERVNNVNFWILSYRDCQLKSPTTNNTIKNCTRCLNASQAKLQFQPCSVSSQVDGKKIETQTQLSLTQPV